MAGKRQAAALYQRKKASTINGGGYLLVEFWFDSSRRYVMSALEKLSEAGYKLILAHPERYDFVRRSPEILIELYRKEIILQVNKGVCWENSAGARFARLIICWQRGWPALSRLTLTIRCCAVRN